MNRTIRAVGSALVVVALVLGAGSARAASLSGPGISATITASFAPSSLPKRGSASVALSASGTITDLDGIAKTLALRLDPQLAVDGTDFATCKPSDVTGTPIAQARQRCKAALVGSGRMVLRSFGPEGSTGDFPASVLLFNGSDSRLLTYAVVGEVTAAATGTARGHVLEVALPVQLGGMLTEFDFRFSKTLSRGGEKVGYLNGRCASGTLHNRITLTTSNGGSASALLPQSCQGRA